MIIISGTLTKRSAVLQSAGTLLNPFPAAFLLRQVRPITMNAMIPIYHADGSLYAWASEQRFARLQSAGLVARVVCQRKGRINRAILFGLPGDPTLTRLSAYS